MKILIIDDSVFSQKSMARLLKNTAGNVDLEIAFANNGVEGLKLYKEFQPDCVVLDLLMPLLDGRQFVQSLDKEERSKIIVVSADVQKSIRKEMEDLNILDFINKPLDEDKAEQILEHIRNN